MSDWLDSFVDIADNRKAAEAALDDLRLHGQRTRRLLAPILAEALLIRRRSQTRSIERTVPLDSLADRSRVADRRRLLDEHFTVGDRYVSWGDATIADHEARIAYLRRYIAGLNDTIERHYQAITMIRAAGATCLNEIEPAA